jgi:hypothetical protein
MAIEVFPEPDSPTMARTLPGLYLKIHIYRSRIPNTLNPKVDIVL